jgi:hypothetical protein
MKFCVLLLLITWLALGLTACNRDANGECFDHPDRFAAELEKDAKTSLQNGATISNVRQFCTQRRLLIVQKDSEVYCTAEAHRGLSRCSSSLEFRFTDDGRLQSISVDEPSFKNP